MDLSSQIPQLRSALGQLGSGGLGLAAAATYARTPRPEPHPHDSPRARTAAARRVDLTPAGTRSYVLLPARARGGRVLLRSSKYFILEECVIGGGSSWR